MLQPAIPDLDSHVKIVGGRELSSESERVPWFAFLVVRTPETTRRCGGTVVSETHIVSAGEGGGEEEEDLRQISVPVCNASPGHCFCFEFPDLPCSLEDHSGEEVLKPEESTRAEAFIGLLSVADAEEREITL